MNGHPSGTMWHPLVGPGSCYFYVLVPPKKHSQLLERKVTSIEFSIASTQAAGDVREGSGSWSHGVVEPEIRWMGPYPSW